MKRIVLKDGFKALPKQKQRAHLVDGDAIHVGVIHKPDDLVGEEFAVVLRGQVGLGGLGGIQLQPFADALPEHIEGGVGLHDLSHGLLDQRLASGEPVTVGTVKRDTYFSDWLAGLWPRGANQLKDPAAEFAATHL